jgi:hypothetical protein
MRRRDQSLCKNPGAIGLVCKNICTKKKAIVAKKYLTMKCMSALQWAEL